MMAQWPMTTPHLSPPVPNLQEKPSNKALLANIQQLNNFLLQYPRSIDHPNDDNHIILQDD